jgi:predicted RNA-binding protein YlqC (UPF0109 family)
MVELVKYIVTQLVENKDAVVVTREGDAINVSVDKKDMGKVIGRQGKIAKALRSIVKAAGQKSGERLNVEILEADGKPYGGGSAVETDDESAGGSADGVAVATDGETAVLDEGIENPVTDKPISDPVAVSAADKTVGEVVAEPAEDGADKTADATAEDGTDASTVVTADAE